MTIHWSLWFENLNLIGLNVCCAYFSRLIKNYQRPKKKKKTLRAPLTKNFEKKKLIFHIKDGKKENKKLSKEMLGNRHKT